MIEYKRPAMFALTFFLLGFYFYWKPIQPTVRQCELFGVSYLGYKTRFGQWWFYCKYFAVGYAEFIRGVDIRL